MAHLDAHPTGDQEVAGFTLAGLATIYHEIFSSIVHSLPLIQEGQLSVSGNTGLLLRGLSLPSKSG